jgi:hypothetical protein
MLPNRSGFAALLAFPLAACKEEEMENASGAQLDVHEDVLAASEETKDETEKTNERKNDGPGTASNRDCKSDLGKLDVYSIREIAPNVLQARTEGSSGCRDKEMVTSITEGPNYEFKIEAGYKGEAGKTDELIIRKDELSIKDGDRYGQFIGEWPDNEFSHEFLRWLPKPNMPFKLITFDMREGINKDFGIIFKEMPLDRMKDYAEQVKRRGFTLGAQTKDKPDLSFFVYEARNPEGYVVKISCVGDCVLGLKWPKN